MVRLRPQRRCHLLKDRHPLAALVVQADAACSMSAVSRSSGSFFPLSAARLRIPRQALGLKKYLSGTPSIKIDDKVDAPPSLGDSPVLGIENSPRERETILQDKSGSMPFLSLRDRHLGVSDPAELLDDRPEILAP